MKDDTRKNLIISTDDFGISRVADVNILDLIEQGKVDRVEVMISPNLKQEDVRRMLESGVKIDIHLHLIREDSEYWMGNRRLKEGAAKRIVMFFINYILGRSGPEKVGLKWAIQIEKFREIFGKNPDGIGSHEYIHFFPPYFKTVLRLAEKYHIPFVRLGMEPFHNDNMVCRVLNWLRKKNTKKLQKAGFSSSKYMVSLDWLIGHPCDYEKVFPSDGPIELVCHPEREDEFEFVKSSL